MRKHGVRPSQCSQSLTNLSSIMASYGVARSPVNRLRQFVVTAFMRSTRCDGLGQYEPLGGICLLFAATCIILRSMRAVDILRNKRDGQALNATEIEAFVAGATSGTWPEYQLSALLMAVVLRGMDARETADLTRAMVYSGVKLDLSD